MGFCIRVSRGGLKCEKIEYDQNIYVMELLVQLAELRDGKGNCVMRNLPIVLVNEFGTSKRVDKIKEKERKLYKDYNRAIKFQSSKFLHLQYVKKLEYDAPEESNRKEASEIVNVLVSVGAPKKGLDSDYFNEWIMKVHNKFREDVKKFKDRVRIQRTIPIE